VILVFDLLIFLVQDIELIEIDEEEDREKEAIKLFYKKYNKIFKFLFNKYANTGFSLQQKNTFESINKRRVTISMAEITKMLKEHIVTNVMIAHSQVFLVVFEFIACSTHSSH
jgi:hypothetical protein